MSVKKLQVTSNIDPAKSASGDVGALIAFLPSDVGVVKQTSLAQADLWKLGNVVYDSGHKDLSYATAYGSDMTLLSDWLDSANGKYVKQFEWDWGSNPSGYAGFYFGPAASSSAGTTALKFDFYSEVAGNVDFTAWDNTSTSYTKTKAVAVGWQSISIPWVGASGFDPSSSFAHPVSSFNIDASSAMATGLIRIDKMRYDNVVTMAGSSPTVLNGVQFDLTKVDSGDRSYNFRLGRIKINQVIVDGPVSDPTRYLGIPRWTYKWYGEGYGAWRGPSAGGYNWLAGWLESGIVNPDNSVVVSDAMLQFSYDAQQAFKTQFPAAMIGPFMPRYGRASWEALNTGGYVAGVWTDNTLNKFYIPGTDNWYGYQYRELLAVAGHYYYSGSAQAKTILDNWMAWLDVYIIADGSWWKPPSNFYQDGTVGYTYKPVYAFTCIAAACIYKYWVDGDALALKWYRRMLDTIYATKRQTATGSCAGVSRGKEGKNYTWASVVFTVNAGAIAPTATAVIAGGKIVRIALDTAGSGITSISGSIVGDGTGATCRPYLNDLLVGAFSTAPTGWEHAEILNTYAMLVNGSRPGGTVNYPATCTADDTAAFNGLVAFYQANTTNNRPSMLNADMIPLHEFDIDPYHDNTGIENPMVKDTHVRGALWSETLAPTLYAAIEYGRYSDDWTWANSLYALVLEFIGLPGGSTHLVNTPRPSNGLIDAYTDMIGGEPLEANKRGNLDNAIYTTDANYQISIPPKAGGSNVTWVRGVWKTAVPFRYEGFMADVDPDYGGDSTNYLSDAVNHPIATTSFSAIASATMTGSSSWNGETMRQRIDTSVITNPDGLASVRVKLQSSSGTSADINKAYIGIAATAGDAFDFASTPVQITFGGNNSVTIPANSEVISDEITISIPAGSSLIVSAYMPTASGLKAKSALAGWQGYYKAGDDAATVDTSGYSTGQAVYGVAVIDTPVVTGTALTKQTIITCDPSVGAGTQVQVYYSYRDGSKTLKGEAVAGWPMKHRDLYQGTANDGDNYMMMSLMHFWRCTSDIKYYNDAIRIGNALLQAGRWDGNEMTFSLPFDAEAGQVGIYSYNGSNTPFSLSIADTPGLRVRGLPLNGLSPAAYAGFGIWPSWAIDVNTPFTSIDLEIQNYDDAVPPAGSMSYTVTIDGTPAAPPANGTLQAGDVQSIDFPMGYSRRDPSTEDVRSLSKSFGGVVEIRHFITRKSFRIEVRGIKEDRLGVNQYAIFNALNEELAKGTAITWTPDFERHPDVFYTCVANKRIEPERIGSTDLWIFKFDLLIKPVVQVPSSIPAFTAA